jgi:hypothetical protein
VSPEGRCNSPEEPAMPRRKTDPAAACDALILEIAQRRFFLVL